MQDDYSKTRDRPRREIKKLARYTNSEGLVAYALTVAEEIPKGVEPSTYIEAISCPSSFNWVLAMQEEMESLHKNQTWDLHKLPKGRRALTAKRIYKRKEGIHGVEEARWKARLVVQGCNQRKGLTTMRYSLLLFVIPLLECLLLLLPCFIWS